MNISLPARSRSAGTAVLVERILQTAAADLTSVAVVVGDREITYGRLLGLAHSVAGSLDQAADRLVGLCASRDEFYVAGALGIMMAGGCFVPLDPALPQDRLNRLVDQANLAVVVSGPTSENVFDGLGATTVTPQIDTRTVAASEVANLLSTAHLRSAPNALAYALFTSGSTGEPKLVAIEQRSVCALVDGFDAVAPAPDRVVSSTVCSFSFDASIFEVFTALCSGGTVHVLPTKIAADPQALAAELIDRRINTAYLPPVGLDFLVGELRATGGAADLARVMVGAESIRQGTLAALGRVAPNLTIVNAYGPTEATVCSTFHVFTEAIDPDRRTPIGKPLVGWSVRVVDENLIEVPVGETGEIIIGGVGLARGYIGAPHLNDTKFVQDSVGERWYRSGDLGRWLPSGDLEFAGRRDHQVKIRGFRIELGEVETALSSCDGIGASIVEAVQGPAGLRLLAFAEGTADPAVVRDRLRMILPDYMIPGWITIVDAFPLTAHAKIDRAALLALPRRMSGSEVDEHRSLTGTQQAVSRLWLDVLDLERIGIDEQFLDLGGDSRLAMVLVNRIIETLGTAIRPSSLLRCQTIAAMAEALDASALRQPSAALPARKEADDDSLSPGQQGLWNLQQLDPGNHSFAIPIAVRVRGPLQAHQLAAAVRRVLAAHDVFSQEFTAGPHGPSRNRSTLPPAVAINLAACSDGPALSEYLTRAYERLAREVVALHGHPWRAEVHHLPDGSSVALLVCHHIIVDGYSLPVLFRDLGRALSDEQILPSPSAPTGRAEVDPKDRAYWDSEFCPVPSALELPTDRARKPQRTGIGHSFVQRLSDRATTEIFTRSARCRTTPFAVVLAAAGALGHRYSGQADFVISIPAAVDRLRPAYAQSVGYFVNLLPIRFQVAADHEFNALIRETSQRLREAVQHGSLPFEDMLPGSGAQRMDFARAVTRFVVAQQVDSGLPVVAGPIAIEDCPVVAGTAKYELSLFVLERHGELELTWEYDSDLFETMTIKGLGSALERLLEIGDDVSTASVTKVDLLSAADRAVIDAANETRTPFPADASVSELFDEQANRTPSNIALVTETGTVTYGELARRAQQLAGALHEHVTRSEEPILVLTDRSVEFVVGVLAVIQAGGSYVPIDSRNPAARLRLICEHAGVNTAIASASIAHLLPPGVTVIDPGSSGSEPANPPARTADSRAYIMFTSGSTGTPKGTEITDRSIVRLVRAQNFARFTEDDTFILASNLAFDAATLEVWGPLLNGGKLVVPDDAAVYDPRELARTIGRAGVTAGFFNVSVFRSMIETRPADLQNMRTILIGGEAVPGALIQQASEVLDHRVLVNGYGPTENTTFSCCHRLLEPLEPGQRFPIGRPVANSTAHVVDHGLREVPVGVIGEIVVGGAGLARGYLGDRELTAQRFVVSPNGERWYRTGDLGRWRPEGVLEFVGRRDDQIKIRGFRIELGEVETALLGCTGVHAAAAMAVPSSGGPRLHGFVEGKTTEEEVRHELSELLPGYLVPARVTILDAFPVTANGKVDRRALLTAAEENSSRPTATPAVAPVNDTQQKLAILWRELLGLNQISIHDNFFDLGGDSKLLVLLTERLRHLWRNELRVVDVMSHPSIAELARFLTTQDSTSRLAATAERRAQMRRRLRS
ncbi:amino acid adenylation domain-containing protein [Actinoplanes sp. NPDC051343]|uniref:amino acid adenylation domain-containing protein n=1 Tax=Actinoplanes sp. NPDC051343 TaxID=3363906 RepID=UPI0037B5852E